jgi:hypothetical protein
MKLPARPKTDRTKKQVAEAWSAVLAWLVRGWVPVKARKVGTAANGSTIENRDPKVTRV